MRSSTGQISVFAIFLVVQLVVTGCGGGGKEISNPPAPPPVSSIASVAVSCSPITVDLAQTTKCSVQVNGTGSFSSEVNWSASAGTIDRNGAYAAPLTARSVTVTATSVQDTTKSGTATIAVVATPANNKAFWWDSWPRVVYDAQVSGALATNSDLLGAHPQTSDEGIGPYYRVNRAANGGLSDLLTNHGEGVRVLGWIEGQGQTREVIGALHQRSDGYEMDPVTGAPRLMADNWSWDVLGPGVNPNANQVLWMGLASFVNEAPWLGPYVRSQSEPLVRQPTYPDGTTALGYDGDPSDPRHARLYDAMASKDLNGNVYAGCLPLGSNATGKILANTGNGIEPCGDFSFSKDVASDFWLDYNRNAVRGLLSFGVDGFFMDNASGWDSISTRPVQVAFGNWSVAKFRSFLGQNTVQGAQDTAAFDIRAYLKSTFASWFPSSDPANLDDPGWADSRWLSDPIWLRYRTFKSQTSRAYLTGMRKVVNEEAERLGIDPDSIMFGGNDVPAISFGAVPGDELDMPHTEYSSDWSLDTGSVGHGLPPYGRASGFYAAATQYGRSRHAIVWYYLEGADAAFRGKPTLGEVLGYEALANNVIINGGSGNADPRLAVTDSSLKAVHDTEARLAPILGGRKRSGAVAVLWSTETQMAYLAPGGEVGFEATTSNLASPGFLDHNRGYYGWCAALEELHVPYRAIPDFRLSTAELAGVSVLVLPHVLSFEPAVVDGVLKPFLARGGAIVVTGMNSGALHTQESFYAPNSSPVLLDLTQTSNLPGQVLFVDGNPGFDYFMGRLAPQGNLRTNARLSIEQALNSLRQSGRLAAELETTAEPFVLAVTHADAANNRYFVDLVNLNIDLPTDTLNQAPASTLTWLVPPALRGRGIHATMYSADGSAETNLTANPTDQTHIQVGVPSFRKYVTIVLN
jgi:hypothetical protein